MHAEMDQIKFHKIRTIFEILNISQIFQKIHLDIIFSLTNQSSFFRAYKW